jgi:hypothetical protein
MYAFGILMFFVLTGSIALAHRVAIGDGRTIPVFLVAGHKKLIQCCWANGR